MRKSNRASAFATLLLASFSSPNTGFSQISTLDHPNIVLVNLDDASADLLTPEMLNSFFPHMAQMADNGLRFTNMHATTPLCGPSRAALFRGQYAFNTGIKVNNPNSTISNGFAGGYAEFVARGHHENELGVWLKNTGYRTLHVGKFHHAQFDGQVPPGWDDFRISQGNHYRGGVRFTNEDSPAGRLIQTSDNDYVTTLDRNDAVDLIHQQEDSEQPFFLYVAPLAPHTPGTFVPEDMVDDVYETFAASHIMPQDPDLFELDTTDKPRHLQVSLSESNMEFAQRLYFARLRAIKSVDDLVGDIFAALENIGANSNTYVLLTSDNGFQTGHHNLQGKIDPFDRTSKVPLLVSGPGVAMNQTADHLLAHIDICPTILELAQSAVPDLVEARSFLPLLFNPNQYDEENWQDGILIENWTTRRNFGQNILGAYVAYRKHHEVFTSWANGEFEYYDLNVDPYQLDNSYEFLTTAERQNFKRLVRRFRTRAIEPITTIDPQFATRMQNRNVRLRGYAEDDSGIHGTQVVVQSGTTLRYWNGDSWQDQLHANSVNPRNFNQPISVWNYRSRIETETENGHDILVFSYHSMDAQNQLPVQIEFHFNEIDGRSPVATFDEQDVPVPVFDENVTLDGEYFDGLEFESAIVTIRNVATNRYFNGQDFQEGRFNLPAELISDHQWQMHAQLPPGFYVAGVRGIDAAGNRQHPANILRFRVETMNSSTPGE